MEGKMKKNIWFPGLPVLLVMGILCAGCDTSTGTKSDTWSDVTSLEQLNGTWKGSYKQTIVIQEAVGVLSQDDNIMALLLDYIKEYAGLLGMTDNITLEDAVALLLGDMKATVSAETITIINASEKTRSGSVKTTITLADGTIKNTWGMFIKPRLQEFFLSASIDATFDDKNHSIILPEQPIAEAPITETEEAELLSYGLQINQNGNKVKVPTGTILAELPAEIPPGMIPSEIILTRQ